MIDRPDFINLRPINRARRSEAHCRPRDLIAIICGAIVMFVMFSDAYEKGFIVEMTALCGALLIFLFGMEWWLKRQL